MNYNDDLEFREERIESRQTIKKHIPLKLKSSNQLNQTPISLNQHLQQHHHQQNSPLIQNEINLNRPDFVVDHVINGSFQSTSNNNLTNGVPFLESNLPDANLIKRNHPINSLNWNLNINSMSQKITEQTMDYCMICSLPILIYGRLLPCKHVMCINCANNIDLKVCLKESCHENIERIETAFRGNIFVCGYDQETNILSPFNIEKFRLQPDISQKKQCGRSYMSQRDLLAHIQHRHDPSHQTD